MGSFISWFERSYKGIIIVLVAIMAIAMVVLAIQHVNESRPAAGAEAGPIPTFSSTPAALPTIDIPKRDSDTRVLYVGDSLSYGAFASAPEKSYRALVDESIKKHTAEVSDFVGGSGKSSADIVEDVTENQYDVVIVEVGTNDATNTPAGSIGKNYGALIEKIRAASPDAGLLCAGSWQTTYQASKVDGAIAATCNRAGGIYVPLQALYQKDENRGPDKRTTFYGVADNFHPNDAGHQAIADALIKRISFV